VRLRVGLTDDHPEPKYSLLKDVKDRIADLTHLIACVLRYNRFYNQLLEDRSPVHVNGIQPAISSAVSIALLASSLQLVTGAVHVPEVLQKFGLFEEYVNQRRWLVQGAPIPRLDAYELDHSNFWISDSSSLTIEQMENNAVEREDSAIPSVQSAPTSFTDLMHHPVVSDIFIPTTTRETNSRTVLGP
jgi:hypothetical protein